MTRLTLYNEEDKIFDQYMKEERHFKNDDSQIILSGPGLRNVFDFFVHKFSKLESSLVKQKGGFDSIIPEDIVNAAKAEHRSPGSGDPVALAAIKWFLIYFAHFLSDQAAIFMPMGGIYLTSSIVNACEFLLLEDETFKS